MIVLVGSPSNKVFFVDALESLGGCRHPLGSLSSFVFLVSFFCFSTHT